jgi:hypothetical protein
LTIVVVDDELAVLHILEAIISFSHVVSGDDSIRSATSLLLDFLSFDRPALLDFDPSAVIGLQEIDIFFRVINLVVTIIITGQGRLAEMNADNPLIGRLQVVPDDPETSNYREPAVRDGKVNIFSSRFDPEAKLTLPEQATC